jgi:hypothetical protein
MNAYCLDNDEDARATTNRDSHENHRQTSRLGVPLTPDRWDTSSPKRQDGIVLESLEVMIGKRILVGITYLGSGDERDDPVELTGTVTAVEPLVTIDYGQPIELYRSTFTEERRRAPGISSPDPTAAGCAGRN